MSNPLDYSKWDKIDCSSSDDDDEGGNFGRDPGLGPGSGGGREDPGEGGPGHPDHRHGRSLAHHVVPGVLIEGERYHRFVNKQNAKGCLNVLSPSSPLISLSLFSPLISLSLLIFYELKMGIFFVLEKTPKLFPPQD